METPQAVLNNGRKIPLVGLGTSAYGVEDSTIESAVVDAIKAGYRHFDTAALYGSERGLGMGLNKAFADALVARSDVFVTTKIWCSDLYPERVLPALNKSLAEMQLEYVDLYMMHWPVCTKPDADPFNLKQGDVVPLDLQGVWKALEHCVEQGLAKSIGVCNFSAKKISNLLEFATVPPAVNQVEIHPMWRSNALREYCRSQGIHVTAYSPLGVPGSPFSQRASVGFLNHPVLLSIASKHNKTTAQVALRWAIEEGVSVIPKSYNAQRLRENIDIFDFSLDEDDKAKFLSSFEQRKIYAGKDYVFDDGPYRSLRDIWDDEAFPDN